MLMIPYRKKKIFKLNHSHPGLRRVWEKKVFSRSQLERNPRENIGEN